VQGDDETLEYYLDGFIYILWKSKHKFDISTIRTFFLHGLIENSRHNLNLLGQGEIGQDSFHQIFDLCIKFSGNRSRSGSGSLSRNNKLGSTDAIMVGLEN